MKHACEGCGVPLSADAEAYVCSYECTFCLTCYFNRQKTCPHCGGELVRRPRRVGVAGANVLPMATSLDSPRSSIIWAVSCGVWIFVALAASLTIWQLYRSTDMPMSFTTTMWMELSQILTYAPLTPFAYAFANRYPIRKHNWGRLSLLYIAAGLLFCLAHVLLRGITPYAIWDSKYREWGSAFWNSHSHRVMIQWAGLQKLFLYNVVDDITGTFLPIVLVAHAVSYYRKFQDRELRATQLEGQLAKAHLQSLKSQLQPHFLFNTMHSISALMLTNVQAADRMITRLADLLRMNLESAGTQITTLSRELEFVNCYLGIEQVRFEDRLALTFDVSPETLDAQVPLMVLQPLVDNAVKHGISRLPKGGKISISSYLQSGDLKLEVRDNGPGLATAGTERGGGLGLRVTRERLETLYGADQSIVLASPPDGGMSVLVTIPFQISSTPPEERASPSNVGVSAQLQEHAS
jgi:two-component system, LytTR family, sensor kinase